MGPVADLASLIGADHWCATVVVVQQQQGERLAVAEFGV